MIFLRKSKESGEFLQSVQIYLVSQPLILPPSSMKKLEMRKTPHYSFQNIDCLASHQPRTQQQMQTKKTEDNCS